MIISCNNFWHSYRVIIFVINLSLRFKYRFGRFHEDFPLKEGTVRVLLPFSRNLPENHSHNLGKALGEGLGLLKTGSLSLSLSLSPLHPIHLFSLFTSLALSPLYPFHLSLSLSLSLIYHSISISLLLPFFLSLSFSLSLLSIILFGVSNRRFRPCLLLKLVQKWLY